MTNQLAGTVARHAFALDSSRAHFETPPPSRGHSTMDSAPVSEAGDLGSIPSARTIIGIFAILCVAMRNLINDGARAGIGTASFCTIPSTVERYAHLRMRPRFDRSPRKTPAE
jgi:hypothetical protein